MSHTITTTFKCSTCSVCFTTRDALKTHHQSSWHYYNLQRRLADKPAVPLSTFEKKWAMYKESDVKEPKGVAHLKNPGAVARVVPVAKPPDHELVTTGDHAPRLGESQTSPAATEASLAYPGVTHSLFDRKSFTSFEENVRYMERTYNLHIPDKTYLVNPKGLIRYLGKKLYVYHQCLYCNRFFKSLESVRGHMISKGHTSIGIGTDDQRDEIARFYDYSESYRELALPSQPRVAQDVAALPTDLNTQEEDNTPFSHTEDDDEKEPSTESNEESDNDSWVTDSDDEEEFSDDGSAEDEQPSSSSRRHCRRQASADLETFLEEKGLRRAYINDLGNLVLPNGAQVAHRSIAYVYRQRLPTSQRSAPERLALVQAQQTRVLAKREGVPRHFFKSANDRRWPTSCQQTRCESRAQQQYDLRLGTKNNKLQRTIRRAEKYFI